MPVDQYFKGSGNQVMATLKERYGGKDGTSVFYALSNKNPKMKPEADRKRITARMPHYSK